MTATTRAPYRPRHAPSAAPAAVPERGLRVVAAGELSPRARRRRNRLIAFSVALFACVGLFGVVAFHVVLTQGQLALDALERAANEEQSKYDRARLLVAELEAPERIVAVAQERLGMVPPPEVTYLSPTGVRVDAPARESDEPRDATATSWPAVKAHLAGGR